MIEWDIYFLTRLNDLRTFFQIIATVLILSTTVFFCRFLADFFYAIDLEDETRSKVSIKATLILGTLAILFSFSAVMTPTAQQYAAIRDLPRMTNPEFLKSIPPEKEKNIDVMARKFLGEIMMLNPEDK